ncbi:zinc finger HIT domain-containing protein 3 isoform X1 [Cavia porcellus]|uniref:zinc finger HIT domain-containing protein 3 isoform X1 n=1 Tax=Cavia porcellus TaxID=10141 RepID=UPI002FE27628
MEGTKSMGKGSNKKGSSVRNPENTDAGKVNAKENEDRKHAISNTAPIDIKRYLRSLIDEFKNEVFNEIKQEISGIVREMLSTTQEKTDGGMEEQKKRGELFGGENRENIEYMKQVQRDYQDTKNSIESWHNSLKETKDRLSELEDRFVRREHEMKNFLKITRKQTAIIQRLEDDKRIYNLRIKNIKEEVRTQTNELQKLFTEIIQENFPNLAKGKDTQMCKAHRTPATYNPNRATPRHTIIKIPEIQYKNRILKAVKDTKQITYKGTPIRITADFLAQTIKSQRAWGEIIQALKDNNLQPRLIYPAQLSLEIDGKTRCFQDKEELGEFATTNSTIQRILQDILKMKNTKIPETVAERPQ